MSDSTNADPLITRDLPPSQLPSTHAHSAAQSGASGSSSLQVRCPNCHSPTEIAVDTRLTDLTCSICGSHFSLVDQSQATRMAPPLSTMGRFELIERLGVGGFGSVWKARDKELDRTVAIKIPRAAGMTPEEQEKFFREARAAAQLRHPSIVSVHEVGRDGDCVYIVSDFVRGVTLGDWLTGQQLTNREAAELCAKIADALHHAHEQGVVHRDLKPANIMMDFDGQPHLMDFGLARRESGEITVTMDGQVLGTPAYMSPEQAQGEAHTADRRSDVYSLGVILFQLLTGELPFRGNARMLIKQVLQDDPPSPRKLNSNVSKDLETLTLKCLEKDPARRYASAAELAAELRRFLAGEPIHARPVGRLERAWRWAKRNPAPAALSAALLGVLLTVSTVAPLVAARQSKLRNEAEAAGATAHAEAERAAREAAASLRLANFVGAKYALTQDRLHEAFLQITEAIQSESSWEYGRILSDIVTQSRRDWQLLKSIPTQTRPKWACFVGTGPKWIIDSEGNSILVRSLLKGEAVSQIPWPGGGRLPCQLGEDRLAVLNETGAICILAVPSLQKVASCEIPGEVTQIAASASGEFFVALNKDRLARVFDRQGELRAEHAFPLVTAEIRLAPVIDIAPSGRAVLYDSGLWSKPKYRWLWDANDVKEFTLQAHYTRLMDDDSVLGTWNSSNTNDTLLFVAMDLTTNATSTLFHGPGLFYSDDAVLAGALPVRAAGESAAGERAGAGQGPLAKDLAGLAMVNARSINFFDTAFDPADFFYNPSGFPIAMSNHATRFSSLWPQAKSEPSYLAYSNRTLALSGENQILVFVRWLPENRGSSVNLSASFWTMNVTENLLYVMNDVTLQSLDLQTFEETRHLLTPPAPAVEKPATAPPAAAPVAEKRMMPWGIVATANPNRVAVLWQEADSRGTVGATYFRKLVAVYALPPRGSKDAPHLINQVELKDFYGTAGRSNRGLWLSSDASLVAFCDSQGKLAAYRVRDGEKIYQKEIGRDQGFYSNNQPPLLGTGNFTKADDFKVWDIATGEIICHFPLDAPVVRGAFSDDGQTMYVGLKTEVTRAYDAHTGRLLSELKTRVAPVAISPQGNRFLGFVPDSSTIGSLVLADLRNGRVLETINTTEHVINPAYFSTDGKAFAFAKSRDQARAMTSLGVDQAQQLLDRPALDLEVAATAEDLLGYRERLAQNLIDAASRAERQGDRGAALDATQRSTIIIKSMRNEYPQTKRYAELLAANFDRCARLEDDQNRKRTFEQYAINLRKSIE